MAEPIVGVDYFRMSTAEQDKSISQQQAWAKSACARHAVTIAGSFKDEAIPGGFIDHRPGLMALLAFCESRLRAGSPVSCVVCWDADRFSRADSIDTGEVLARLRRAGVSRLLTAEGWIDLENEVDRVVFFMKQDMGRSAFSRSMAKNVTRATHQRAMQGYHVGAQPPYGLIVGPDGRLAFGDPVEVETVRWIFCEYRTRTVSPAELARELNARGVPFPERRTKRRARKTRLWNRQDVARILGNPKYAGDQQWNVRTRARYCVVEGGESKTAPRRPVPPPKPTTKRHQLPALRRNPDDRVIVRDAHPAIIDRETFDAVQAKIRTRQEGRGRPRACEKPFVLTGLVICGDCGEPMHGRTEHPRGTLVYRRYVCSTNRHYKTCFINRTPEDLVLDEVTQLIREKFTGPDVIERLRDELDAMARETEGDRQQVRRGLEARITALDGEIATGTRNLAVMPAELVPDVAKLVTGWKAEREQVAAELAQLDCEPAPNAEAVARVADAVKQLQGLADVIAKGEPAKVQDALHGIVQKVVMHFTHTPEREGPNGRKHWLHEMEIHLRPELAAILSAFTLAEQTACDTRGTASVRLPCRW